MINFYDYLKAREYFSDIITITKKENSLPGELKKYNPGFTSWGAPSNIQGWNNLKSQLLNIVEPPIKSIAGLSIGSGVIIYENDGNIWLTHPTNQYGGYKATFPKGTLDEGLSLQSNALKEAYEETGLRVKLLGMIGDVKRTSSVARYYKAIRIGGTPLDMGWESEAVSLVPKNKLKELLNMSVDRDFIKNL